MVLLRKSHETDSELVREVRAMRDGDHHCLLYDNDPSEQLPALSPFIAQGLEQGERCIYVADDHTLENLRRALDAFGVDVASETSRGSLLLWTRAEWRQSDSLDPDKKAEQLREIIADARGAGFHGIRFAVEMTWTLGPEIDAGALLRWEATINTVLTSDVPVRMICQYNRQRLSPTAIETALRTHRVAIIGTDVCPNPFFESPLTLREQRGGDATEQTREHADWMISQLRWLRRFEAEREQRIRTEAALSESESARARMQELYRRAEEAGESLRNAIAVKDEFLGLLSHELRTPITTIRGNAEIVRRSNGRLSSADRENALQDIEQEADRLHRMIENLLAFSRIETEKTIEREPELARRVVDAVVREHRKQFPHRRIDMTIDAPVTPVLLHRGYFEQVMRNLLSNAEKYSPPDAPIDVRITYEDGDLVVSVMDRGPGVASEEADEIFSAFYRSQRTVRKAQGVGIGLAVCRRLMEAQGGSITVSPRLGGGACFTVRLCVEDLDPGDD